ncbi:hypothetical protein MSG28_002587 [Choristoneura fumiferana]|uniref:Uncharacterized protein n=1 Tax=Choristoneura fumiferana TaxID=7141 RepID=A0ACC0JIJ8_CHOFU|nr:hypothetical protein MSG28_002587 [Choristoneura fumiferana]
MFLTPPALSLDGDGAPVDERGGVHVRGGGAPHGAVGVAGAAHPLAPPRVAAAAPAPAPNTHWLAVYLAYQNGTVLSALRMWMDAVARRVEAAPQCYICYCRLHPATGRLPKVPCHQCRNKFTRTAW